MSGLFRNIRIANETLKISARGWYVSDGAEIRLPDADYGKASVFDADEIGKWQLENAAPGSSGGGMIEVVNADTLDAALELSRPLVLNFANAHFPGGGFRLGSSTQEESLCRRSTLYMSLRSSGASRMYRTNNLHPSRLEADMAVLSPSVCVFRDAEGRLLQKPYGISVVSMPAPNLRGFGFLSSRRKVKAGLRRKIHIILSIAVHFGYKNLVLGAWGCGAFGNDPKLVADCFRTALHDDGFVRHFNRIVFAIRGKPDGANMTAFRNVLLP